MLVISDTSGISALMILGRENLLHQLFGNIVIPEAVRDELLASFPSLPSFLIPMTVRNKPAVTKLLEEIDKGEAEAIILYTELGANLLLVDDMMGRELAMSQGLRTIGLLGVLVSAKRNGLISALRPIVDELRSRVHFFMSEKLINAALDSVGEN